MGGVLPSNLTRLPPRYTLTRRIPPGPTFSIYLEADASIEANLELDVDLLYTVSGDQLVYPSSSQGSGGAYAPGDSDMLVADVRLSAGPNVTANAQLSAHLKPSLEFGLSLADHDTGLYLSLDAFAELDLELTAAASSSISSDGSNSGSTCTGAGGCVDIFTGLSVNAGADADLLGLFGADDKVVLYDQEFDLYKACFGDAHPKQKRDSSYSGYSPSPTWGSGRRVPLSLFEQNLRKDHQRVPPQGAVAVMDSEVQAAASAPPKSGKGFSCAPSPAGERTPIVEQKVNATSYQAHSKA